MIQNVVRAFFFLSRFYFTNVAVDFRAQSKKQNVKKKKRKKHLLRYSNEKQKKNYKIDENYKIKENEKQI